MGRPVVMGVTFVCSGPMISLTRYGNDQRAAQGIHD
jgi:hypothetical protein